MNAAIQRVTHDRVPDAAQVSTNLVRTAGVDGNVRERQTAKRVGLRDPGDGFACASGAHRHTLAVRGVPADRSVDPPSCMDHAPHERNVLLLHLAIVELPRQFPVRMVPLCDDEDARRAAIEAVYDARPQFAADATQVLDVMEQGVDQRARLVAGPWVDHHAGCLVQHHDVAVLVQDVHGQRFRLDRSGPRRG